METTSDLSKKFKILLVVIALVAVGAVAATGFLYMKLQSIEVTAKGPNAEADDIAAAVGKSLVLPQGEDPELVTISDLDQVRGQAFFANALIGDKVLVYKQAAKAILWRPSIKKIIEVYPINISAQ